CYPAETENTLCDMTGVARAAVIGGPDDRMGEAARAFLVRDAGVQLDEATVIAWARDNMANYKVPRSVVFLDELPMNAGGKVDKAALASGGAGGRISPRRQGRPSPLIWLPRTTPSSHCCAVTAACPIGLSRGN
ncbi:MAG: hypothetical protein GY813_00840, partial [Halieaceae bacterium]|nr:hypothetical protein [Halieaceae bacterium]